MGVDWILAKVKKVIGKSLEEFSNLDDFRKNLNDKQKDYLANILAVTSGAVIFKAWEETFPLREQLSQIEIIELITSAILSLILILGGLWLHASRRRNGFKDIHSS